MRLIIIAALSAIFCTLIGCGVTGPKEFLEVVRYSGPPITESEVYDQWTLRIEGDTFVLRELKMESDPERNVGLALTLKNNQDFLPILEDVWYGPLEGGIGRRVTVARLEVQSWDVDALLSGVVRAELPTGGVAYKYFWVNLPSQN